MKVVHVSTHDVAGGAARAALRIHRGLLQVGVDSSMLVAVKGGQDPSVVVPPLDRSVPARVRRWRKRAAIRGDMARYANTRPPGFERFSDDRTELGSSLVDAIRAADIIHLHWISDFLDYREFFRSLPRNARLVWTLHDMNPLTGGCHYDEGCDRFTVACGACPQLGSLEEGDLSREIWSRKLAALSELPPDRMCVVGSQWMAGEARRSTLLGRFPASTVVYGLDTNVFKPGDRAAARATLGIGENARVLLFVSDSLDNRRKGFAHLIQSLNHLQGIPDLQIVSIGGGSTPYRTTIPHLHIDRIDDDERLAMVYSAADVFVIPSLHEAFGQTALEAMACGTPAVGFDVGGVPEAIREGETGLLAPVGDSRALAERIESLLMDKARRDRMSQRSREVAVTQYSLEVQARKYLAIYEALRGEADVGLGSGA